MPHHIFRFLSLALLIASIIGAALAPAELYASDSAHAHHKAGKHHKKKHKPALTHAAAVDDHFSALVVNADNGQVLYEKNAGGIRYPASLTKMMTLYLTFDALKQGKLKIDATLPVSAKAAAQPQTNISLTKGSRLPLRTAIESVVVRSANDSAMVLAEALGGTDFDFALMMTRKARQLGMKDTIFKNPNGLPDNEQHTTAFDMAKLAIALRRDFPEYYPYFKMQSFAYNGVIYPGHNHVMARYAGVDGVKTGFIRASGFNLVTSAHKNGHNLVAVILGGTSIVSRDNQMIALLDQTFAQLDNQRRVAATRPVQPVTTIAAAAKKSSSLDATPAASGKMAQAY